VPSVRSGAAASVPLLVELAMQGYLRLIRMFVGPEAQPSSVFFDFRHRRRSASLLLTAFSVSAANGCNSVSDSHSPSHGAGSSAGAASASSDAGSVAASQHAFNPPPAAAGYTRIVAPVMANLAPGSDITNCQYVHAPFDRDMDVLDVTGYPSLGGLCDRDERGDRDQPGVH
jgi:hypothetical protein